MTGSIGWPSFMIRALAKLAKSIEDLKNADIIKVLSFWSIFGRGRTTKPSQNACNLYIFWKKILLAIISFWQNTKKLFLFWRNRPFSNTLIFADFCWRQQKLEGLWQQTIYQETPFYLVCKLTKFYDQRISQTGFMAGRAFGPTLGDYGDQKARVK